MSSPNYLFFCLLLVASSQAFTVDDLTIQQPSSCASIPTGNISFIVNGATGTVNIVWSPAGYAGDSLTSLPLGVYQVTITDDIDTFINTWEIAQPAPLTISNAGPYWSTSFSWYSNLTEYVALSCTRTENPDLIGYPGGYGRWDAPAAFGKVETGGTPPYSYFWVAPYGTFSDPSAQYPDFYPNTPMVLFNLTVIVTDSMGCSAQSDIPFVLQQLDPILEIEPSSVGGSDGSFSLGFTGRYELSNFYFKMVTAYMNNTVTGLIYSVGGDYEDDQDRTSLPDMMPAGQYGIYYDTLAGLCQSQLEFTIGAYLTFSSGLPSILLPNTLVNIVSDGTGPFIYLWEALGESSSNYGLNQPTLENPGFFPDHPVHYRLTVIDSNQAIGVLETIFNPLEISGLPATVDYCDSYTFSPVASQGQSPYSYSWSPSQYVSDPYIRNPATVLPTGATQTLILTVIDNLGVSTQQNVLVSQSSSTIISFLPYKDCNATTGGIRNIVVAGNNDHCWTLRQGAITMRSGTSLPIPDLTGLLPGTYTLEVACGICPPVTTTITINDCVGSCPYGSLKMEPGQCGCDTEDIDLDRDGVASCLDLCDTNCETIGQCPIITTIPASTESSHIEGRIYDGTIGVGFWVTSNTTQDFQVFISQDTLVEIDTQGIEIQSLSLIAITWDNILIRYDGFKILVSSGVGYVNGHAVNLTWNTFFFQDYCTYPLTAFGTQVDQILCQNISFVDFSREREYLNPGDSKISFNITNWPFLNPIHRLRAEILYSISIPHIDRVDQETQPFKEIFRYTTEYEVILAASFLKKCLIGSQAFDVDLEANTTGAVRIVFPYFQGTLKYDPNLSFLFSAVGLSDKVGWFPSWASLMAAGIALVVVVLVILASLTDTGHKILLGGESYRVMHTRDYIKKHSDEIDRLEAESRQVSKDLEGGSRPSEGVMEALGWRVSENCNG